MYSLEDVRNAMPEAAKDIRLNLQSVVEGGSLTPAQKWGVVVTSAFAARHPELAAAAVTAAAAEVDGAVIEDAKAAAVLMGMNNVFYRFRHMVGKEVYGTKRAGLRMNRIVSPLTNKADFELFCLVASAINGCEMCVRSHEKVVIDGGLTEDQVHDAVRIASVFHAAAVGLEVAAIGSQV